MKKGLFIVFEGLDRCGKSTQVEKLYEHLNSLKRKVNLIKFPDRETAIGKLINSYLQNKNNVDDHVIHLLFTANRWEIVPKIKSMLDNEEIVICDRYLFSGIAYSAAKDNVEYKWCETVEYGLPRPDIVFYMDVSFEEMRKRNGFGDERYEKTDFQKRVKENFDKLIKNNPFNDTWKEIDANQSISKVHEDILHSINNLFVLSRDSIFKKRNGNN